VEVGDHESRKRERTENSPDSAENSKKYYQIEDAAETTTARGERDAQQQDDDKGYAHEAKAATYVVGAASYETGNTADTVNEAAFMANDDDEVDDWTAWRGAADAAFEAMVDGQQLGAALQRLDVLLSERMSQGTQVFRTEILSEFNQKFSEFQNRLERHGDQVVTTAESVVGKRFSECLDVFEGRFAKFEELVRVDVRKTCDFLKADFLAMIHRSEEQSAIEFASQISKLCENLKIQNQTNLELSKKEFCDFLNEHLANQQKEFADSKKQVCDFLAQRSKIETSPPTSVFCSLDLRRNSGLFHRK
jgi:hypothetical protein